MTIRTYSSPEAFKQALEQRLRTSAKSGAAFARKRQLLVFDRFLARVVAVLGDAATLKGGLVLELRIEHARTTKDVDLRMVGSPDDILTRLQEAARRDLADFMTFEVGPVDHRATVEVHDRDAGFALPFGDELPGLRVLGDRGVVDGVEEMLVRGDSLIRLGNVERRLLREQRLRRAVRSHRRSCRHTRPKQHRLVLHSRLRSWSVRAGL